MALDSSPSTHTTWDSVDYSLYYNGGSLLVYETGVSKYTYTGTFTGAETLGIIYDGIRVYYTINGAAFYSTARAISTSLYLSGFLRLSGADSNNSGFSKLIFGPMGTSGANIAIGGATGQIVYKNSGTDFDTSWAIDKVTDNFVVAVGQAGASGQGLMYSYNGLNWILSPTTLFANCLTIAYNGVLWVAGGNEAGPAGVIAYSYDGINWTRATSATALFTYCNAIAASGSLWVAVGILSGAGAVAYSSDGINWTNSASGSSLFTSCKCITWTGSLWVAGGVSSNSGKIAYSYDGITWTTSASGDTEFLNGVNGVQAISSNGYLIVAGGGYDGNSMKVVYSSNGITWTNGTDISGAFDVASSLYSVAWNGTLWVLVGTSLGGEPGFVGEGRIFYSYNGSTWTRSANDTTIFPESRGSCNSLCWNGSIWLVSGNTNASTSVPAMTYSIDGNTWIKQAGYPLAYVANCLASRRQLPYSSILNMPYIPTYTSLWTSPAPATVGRALDRISVLLSTLNSGNIP
jgi:hypothetical protein